MNSKAFKKKVREWMGVNPGWSYMAAAQHLRELESAQLRSALRASADDLLKSVGAK